MAKFRDYYRQLRDRLGEPSFPIVAAMVLIGIGILSAVIWSQRKLQSEYLFDGRELSSSELMAVEVAFAKAKLAGYQLVSQKISVPRDKRGQYIKAIVDADALPARLDSKVKENELSGNLFETRSQRLLRMQAERERKLSQAIVQLGGIESAEVRFDERSSGGLKPDTAISANVLVNCETDRRLDQRTVVMIREMVAGERIGLVPERVTVTDLNARVVHRGGFDTAAADSHQILLDKIECEEAWQQKIAAALAHIPSCRIIVSSDVDATPKRVGVSSPNASTRLAVFVNIPNSYYQKLWKDRLRTTSRTSQSGVHAEGMRGVKQKTEEKVVSIVKTLTSVCSTDAYVQVASFDDSNAGQSQRNSTIRTRTFKALSLAILTVVLVAVGRALFGFRMPKSDSNTSDQSTPEAHDHKSVMNVADSGDPPIAKFDSGLREQVSQVVRRDPQAAAKVLEGWLRKAS